MPHFAQHIISLIFCYCLSMESIRLGGSVNGIVTKTVHKTLPGGGGGPVGWADGWVGGGGGPGDGGVQG